MKLQTSITLLLGFLASASAESIRKIEEPTQLHDVMFQSWANDHSKEYASDEEKEHRMRIWMQNHIKIELHNNQVPEPKFKLGHNAFSDMTQDEYAELNKLGIHASTHGKLAVEENFAKAEFATFRHLEDPMLELPKEVNWIALGGVTDVKNQGACGSCWAFSTTGALEGAKFVKTGELVALSEQNLLDCDHKDLGCNGGLMDNAFKFDEKTGGLCSEADYPYEAKQGKKCNPTNCTDVPGTIVSTFYDVPKGEPKALMAAVAMQPISVAIQADQFVFQFYKTGVLTDDKCGKQGMIDHGVLAVGYGTDSETQEPYWLVKNSWGDSWGEKGYIRLGRNSKNDYGMCAILKAASFPEVKA
jgi:C1A family cysteine protease